MPATFDDSNTPIPTPEQVLDPENNILTDERLHLLSSSTHANPSSSTSQPLGRTFTTSQHEDAHLQSRSLGEHNDLEGLSDANSTPRALSRRVLWKASLILPFLGIFMLLVLLFDQGLRSRHREPLEIVTGLKKLMQMWKSVKGHLGPPAVDHLRYLRHIGPGRKAKR